MNKLLFGAATAAMLVAVSPAFAVDGECKEMGYAACEILHFGILP